MAVQGTPVAEANSIQDLKPFKLGAPIGTTSFDVIEQQVQPEQDPAVFDSLHDAIQALKNDQVDGIVADVPSAFIIIAVQVDGGVIVGQFPQAGAQEFFGMVFEEGNPLRDCVNQVLDELRSDGTLDALEERCIAEKGHAPVLE